MILAGGGTRTFRGPGTFSPSAAPRPARAPPQNGGRIARIGAVRSAGIVPRGPTIWHVDVTQSGNFCLAGTANVMLWRPDASAPARLTIAGPAGAPRVVPWPAGQPTRAWPRGAAIANGATYSFSQPGVAVPTRITFRILDTPLNDVQGVAEALIANGCEGQLDVLVESQPDQTARATEPPRSKGRRWPRTRPAACTWPLSCCCCGGGAGAAPACRARLLVGGAALAWLGRAALTGDMADAGLDRR